LLTAILGVLSR
jgi:hypothetical protein